MTREPIMAALFAKLSAIPGIVTSSRILAHINEVQAPDQPALFLVPSSQIAERKRGLPPKWTIDVSVYLYVKRTGRDIVPDQLMNPLLDAIESALAPSPVAEVQTLGGLVEHCWIEGAIQTDEGILGDQAVAVIPIRLLVTA